MKNSLFSIAAMIGLLLFAAIAVLKASEVPAFEVKVTGKGKPVILIPGLACSGEVWNETVSRYQTGNECHILTLAGFAGVLPAKGSTLSTVSSELAKYIRENRLDHPVIVGHSLGGFIALKLASQEPDLVGQLIIVDALPFLPAAQMPGMTIDAIRPQAEMLRKMITNQTREQYRQTQPSVLMSMMKDTSRMKTVLEWGLASDPGTTANAMYELMTTDLRETIATIKTPVLVLGTWIAYRPFGATHQSMEQVFAAQYAKLQNCEIRMADDAKHFIMFDDPNWFFVQLDGVLMKTN